MINDQAPRTKGQAPRAKHQAPMTKHVDRCGQRMETGYDILACVIDFFLSMLFESILSLPALPRDSQDWKRRRKYFVFWTVVGVLLLGVVVVFTSLDAIR
jgi:hypothetical protein